MATRKKTQTIKKHTRAKAVVTSPEVGTEKPRPSNALKRIERIAKRRDYVPSYEDSMKELRQLVSRHRALTRSVVSIANMAKDKKAKVADPRRGIKAGQTIKNLLPVEVRSLYKDTAKKAKSQARVIEQHIEEQLVNFPIYTKWLCEVYGMGPVVCAYIVTSINVKVREDRGLGATKPSNVIRYAGLAVINDKLERRSKARDEDGNAKASGFNGDLRVRIYQAFCAMMKNVNKGRVPRGEYTSVPARSNKYLKIYVHARHSFLSRPNINRATMKMRVPDDKKGGTKEVSARGAAHSYGWHKAMRVFLNDLYIVWRSLEGLPVWHDWYAMQRGYIHGGKMIQSEAELLTLEEAKNLVGDVGRFDYHWDSEVPYPATVPKKKLDGLAKQGILLYPDGRPKGENDVEEPSDVSDDGLEDEYDEDDEDAAE